MKKAISLILTLLLIFNFLPLNFIIEAFAEDGGQLIIYPEYDERIPRCYDYSVTVHQGNQSKTIPYIIAMQTENRWLTDAYHLTLTEDSANLLSQERFGLILPFIVILKHTVFCQVAKRYRNEFHDGVISVWLNENDTKFMIRLDDDDDTILSVFADAPEDYDIDPNDDLFCMWMSHGLTLMKTVHIIRLMKKSERYILHRDVCFTVV